MEAELPAGCPHVVDRLALIGAAGISTPEHRIGNLFYALTPRADCSRQLMRDLVFEDPDASRQ